MSEVDPLTSSLVEGVGDDPVAAAMDPVRLAEWMDGQGLEPGKIEDASLLTGGTQNILVQFTKGGRRFVLRRPSISPRPKANETINRESLLLRALAGSDVPHPGLIAACEDTGVLGASFYLMEPVDGFTVVSGLPEPHNSDNSIRHCMGLSLVEGAAALHALEPDRIGLGDLGTPAGFLQRQPDRWMSQYESYGQFDGWSGPASLPYVAEASRWLAGNTPDTSVSGILHGDYQLGNVMYRHDSGDLAAIVDWELATQGDPLIDLGWIIATWPGAGGPDLPRLRVSPWVGFPTAQELISHYASRSDRDLSRIDWYVALACFKLAVILEGTHARAAAGLASKATGDFLHATATALMGRARHWMTG
jgi:aminoglycoside phosphotransferase (APT) family kinase protein